ncbi:MAG: PP2C family protein-serine/threonine phosphatase [Phycisphaeraceae bacterium]
MPRILLISHEEDRPHFESLAEQVMSVSEAADRPKLNHAAAADLLHDDASPAADAAWLYTGTNLSKSNLYALLDVLAQRGIPTLLSSSHTAMTAGQFWQESAVMAPPDDQPREIHLMLQGMLCGGQASEQTRQDLKLLQRQHTGVRGQITRLDEELRFASRLQRQFLPATLPKLAGVSFEVLFRPAGYVSGDIYDVQCLDRHHSSFFVADAVGHGVPAALLTMFIKQALQPREVHGLEPRILQPDEALARLNRDMCERQHGPTQFATACYGLLDIRTKELLLARAGHPPPVLVRATGEVELLKPDGALLGVFEEEEFELHRIKVREGDRLLIYSDGFEFAFGSEGAHMVQDYAEELRRLCEGPMEQVVARIEDRLDQQAGSLHQQDDLTVLLIDITPQHADAEAEIATASV